jgi:hypothetical protein
MSRAGRVIRIVLAIVGSFLVLACCALLFILVRLGQRPSWCTSAQEARRECLCDEFGCLRGPRDNPSPELRAKIEAEGPIPEWLARGKVVRRKRGSPDAAADGGP